MTAHAYAIEVLRREEEECHVLAGRCDDKARGVQHPDVAETWWREAAEYRAHVVELRAAIAVLEAVPSVVEDLRDHDREECAGPRGTGRRGACRDCRHAAVLEAGEEEG